MPQVVYLTFKYRFAVVSSQSVKVMTMPISSAFGSAAILTSNLKVDHVGDQTMLLLRLIE